MLSAIKKGKRKRKPETPNPKDDYSTVQPPREDANAAAAVRLRASLGDEHAPTCSNIVLTTTASVSRKNEEDMTVQELLKREKTSSAADDLEREVRAVARKKHAKIVADDAHDDYDDAAVRQYIKATTEGDASKTERRERNRLLARHDQQQAYTRKCWWWLEAPTFDRNRLLALDSTLSLVWTPRRTDTLGHLSLVPVTATASLAATWSPDLAAQLRKFHARLSRLYAPRRVLLAEQHAARQHGFHQCRCHVVIVEDETAEVELFLAAALRQEQSKQFTLSPVKNMSHVLPRSYIPPYVWVQYDATGNGLLQIWNDDHHAMPTDLVLDTILGAMGEDPMRLRRDNKVNNSDEKAAIAKFRASWDRQEQQDV